VLLVAGCHLLCARPQVQGSPAHAEHSSELLPPQAGHAAQRCHGRRGPIRGDERGPSRGLLQWARRRHLGFGKGTGARGADISRHDADQQPACGCNARPWRSRRRTVVLGRRRVTSRGRTRPRGRPSPRTPSGNALVRRPIGRGEQVVRQGRGGGIAEQGHPPWSLPSWSFRKRRPPPWVPGRGTPCVVRVDRLRRAAAAMAAAFLQEIDGHVWVGGPVRSVPRRRSAGCRRRCGVGGVGGAVVRAEGEAPFATQLAPPCPHPSETRRD
jgi:hypothetical protein